MIITVEELSAYTGNEDESLSPLKEIYISSAESIVEEYLGYSPVSEEYTHILSGGDKCFIQLKAQPVSEIKSISVNGVSLDKTDFITDKEMLIEKNQDMAFVSGTSNVLVNYVAGYPEEKMLGVIKLTVLRIAALMSSEAGGNIGVSSKSFGDSGTRSFINTKDYQPYLKLLDSIKIERI